MVNLRILFHKLMMEIFVEVGKVRSPRKWRVVINFQYIIELIIAIKLYITMMSVHLIVIRKPRRDDDYSFIMGKLLHNFIYILHLYEGIN